MRDDFESNSHSSTGEQPASRKQILDKKRAIRKDKVRNSHNSVEQPTRNDSAHITREERAALQKVRNREAAQRSREQHKKYVEDLEAEVQDLKQKLKNCTYCKRCQKQLQTDVEEGFTESMGSEQVLNSVDELNLSSQEIGELPIEAGFNDDGDSTFTRMRNRSENSFNMFLFIAMIALAVFTIGNYPGQSEPAISAISMGEMPGQARDLFQVSDSLPQNENGLILESSLDMENKINRVVEENIPNGMNLIAPLNHEIRLHGDEKCLRDLIGSRRTWMSGWKDKNLREEGQLMRSQSPNNVLFCQIPRVYRPRGGQDRSIFTRLIDIVVSGPELTEIMEGANSELWFKNVVDFKGIYRIHAEVKDVMQITDQSCIL